MPEVRVELVAVVHVAAALDDDVAVRLEQADQFLSRRHRFTLEDAPLGLLDNLLDQGEPRAHRGKPGLDLDAGTRGGAHPGRGGTQIAHGRAGDGDQVSIQHRPLGLLAAMIDGLGTPLGPPAVIMPGNGRRLRQIAGGVQQAHHDPHGVAQEPAVARLVDHRLGHGAIQAQQRAGLDLGLAGAGQ